MFIPEAFRSDRAEKFRLKPDSDYPGLVITGYAPNPYKGIYMNALAPVITLPYKVGLPPLYIPRIMNYILYTA